MSLTQSILREPLPLLDWCRFGGGILESTYRLKLDPGRIAIFSSEIVDKLSTRVVMKWGAYTHRMQSSGRASQA